MAAEIFANNSTAGYGTREVYVHFGAAAGNITADATAIIKSSPVTGTVVDVVGSAGTNGVDATNPLQMVFTASKNGTALCSTDPVITKAAGTGAKSTVTAGTGITSAVVSATAATVAVAKGDSLKMLFDITRTASPGTEIADVSGFIVIRPTA